MHLEKVVRHCVIYYGILAFHFCDKGLPEINNINTGKISMAHGFTGLSALLLALVLWVFGDAKYHRRSMW